MKLMDNDTVIKVEGLYKKFCRSIKRTLFYGSMDLARSILGIPFNTGKLRKSEFWSLEDINLELKKGDALGIIGLNGSGKSTLLRLLSGIFPPDKGRITVKGKIGSLIAVGAGFHPHMSGRENIYLNASILGMSKKEIHKKFKSIVDFADIGQFLDAPVSTYSSGMTVRLGFAIAIHCEPDILLVDEILSVGDLSFRNKSLRHMAEYRKKASALIFVTHDLEQIRNLCNKVIVMHHGKMLYNGPTHQGIVVYEEITRDMRLENMKDDVKSSNAFDRKEIDENAPLTLEEVGIMNNGSKVEQIRMDEPLDMYAQFKVNADIEGLYFSISIHSDNYSNKNCIWVMSNDNNKSNFSDLKKGKYSLKVSIPNHHLNPGVYLPTISIRNSKTGETYERVALTIPFKVTSSNDKLERGIVNVDEKWNLDKID